MAGSEKNTSIGRLRVYLLASSFLAAIGTAFAGLFIPNRTLLPKEIPDIVLTVCAAVIFIAAIFLFSKYRKGIKEQTEKRTGALTVISAILILVIGFSAAISVPRIVKEIEKQNEKAHHDELNDYMQKYVKDDWTSKNAELPKKPKLVKYDMDKKDFYYDTSHIIDNNYFAETPEEVNIVIAYKYVTTRLKANYKYVDSGKHAGSTYEHQATLYAIRAEDWSLIDEKDIYRIDGKTADEMDVLDVVEENDFELRYLFENGKFEEDRRSLQDRLK